MIISKEIEYGKIEKLLNELSLPFLQQFFLFDIFESDKIGPGKKSLAINFIFSNREKTLTDADINMMMGQITKTLESDLNAEIRK